MNAAGTDSPLPLRMIVVCRSAETATRWRNRAPFLKGLEIEMELGCQSYYRLLARIISGRSDRPVIVCHDDIRCGLDFAVAVGELLAELERNRVRWGICGNAGISCDGRQIFRFIHDPHGGPRHALAPEPVLAIDGNLMLLNVPVLAAAGVEVPDMDGFQGYDIALSLETLRAGLPVLCDRRLFVMHKSGGDNAAFRTYVEGEDFRKYLAQRIINHVLPTINGLLDLSASQDYRYLEIPALPGMQRDIFDLFDGALCVARSGIPTVTIGCRTQFNRPELLTRAVASFAVAALQAPELIDLRVRIISDRPGDIMTAELERLGQLFPDLDMAGCVVSSTTTRYSRTAALLEAVASAETDFIWFVDDDDFILPGAIKPLARTLAPKVARLIVGNSRRMAEIWAEGSSGQRTLKESRLVGENPAAGVFHAFSGDNHTPICSVVFPVATLRERLHQVAARGDYYEDYFLLLLTLTADRIELRLLQEDMCGISIRAGENTVTEQDREHWDLSYATFMSELLRHPAATSPLLWQLAEENVRIVTVPQRDAITQLRYPASRKVLVRSFFVLARHSGLRVALRKAWRYLFPAT